MKNTTVTNKGTGNVFTLDEHSCESEMRASNPLFFLNRRKGTRETYSTHRGQLIVRQTVKFTNCPPVRKTSIWLYITSDKAAGDKNWLFCVSTGCNPELESTAQAKKLIDKILDNGVYEYGISL